MIAALLIAAAPPVPAPAPQVVVTARDAVTPRDGAPRADDTDFEALSQAVTTCDRGAVGGAVTQEGKRRGAFLLEAYGEQRDIAAERADLAERRLRLRVPAERGAPKATDTDAALTLAGQVLDDRQRALDDARTLDRLRQEMIGYFRQLYLSSCQARP